MEIAWPQKRSSSPRDILISLRTSFADFATAFTEVVDFVPYEDSLKQLARNKDVTFVSDATDEVVASLHKSIGFLLVPSVEHYQRRDFSRPELLGLVALEALAAGTPVIGSDVGGLGELLKMAGQITVQPGDVPKWHQALSKAAGSRFPSVTSSAFTWDAVAGKCIELYRSL